jgi:hypothetical protein
MILKRFLGWAIVIGAFLGVFSWVTYDSGVKVAAISFLFSAVLAAVVGVGVFLIFKGKPNNMTELADLWKKRGKRIYLCAPYSHPDPEVREARVAAADMQAAQLMEAGHIVYSPLSHSHRIAYYIDNHLDHDFWLKQCLPFVDWCDEVWVMTVDGYKESRGINKEIEYAKKTGKPVEYLEAV